MMAALLWLAALSLPSRVPINCSAQAGCGFKVYANATVIVIARFGSPPGTITGALGETWISDQCVGFTGACSFHAKFPSTLTTSCGLCSDTITFSGNDFSDVLIFIYDGLWDFDTGNAGTYNAQNSVFSDCVNGQDCPYAWTLPIETEAGNLLIAWGDNIYGSIIRPGPGYIAEARSANLFVEDTIAPIKGVYIGSFTTRLPDGSESGGSHWLAGVAAYKKAQ